jgi:hypothetical protein
MRDAVTVIVPANAPHVVALHFRGLGCVDVSPYWLGDPGVRISDSESHARSGIPVDPPAARPKPHDSSHAVAPTTGSNPTRPANSRPPGHPTKSPRVRTPRRASSRSATRGSPRVWSPRRASSRSATRKGHREPDHPEGPPGAQPPRRAAEMPLSATLMEFPAPSTLELRRVHSTPACLTGYVPPTGFHTLSTAYSSPERPALFHAGNAHGVFRSPGAFPHRQVPSTRRHGITLLTFFHRTNEWSMRGACLRTPKRASQTFAASRALLRR